MNEIIFLVEDAPDGGLSARAVGESIFTQAATMSELHERVRDAVRCHFEAGDQPRMIRRDWNPGYANDFCDSRA